MNDSLPPINSFTEKVLIDTWWNVNIVYGSKTDIGGMVLIDTWWNVNLASEESRLKRLGFNRYMVECEL